MSSNHIKAIGVVASQWSYAETLHELLIIKISELPIEQGQCITTHIGSETRINILESLIEIKAEDEQAKKDIKDLSAEMRRLRTERNNIIHSIWLPENAGELKFDGRDSKKRKIIAHKATARGILKRTKSTYTTKRIMEIADEINTLCIAITVLLNGARKRKKSGKILFHLEA